MRFTRFPRVEQPSPPSARRVAAAKRAVQAEKDRYPLFPELVRYATTESRLDAMQEHRIAWWQQHRNHVAASWREARASLRSLPPGPRTGILRYWQTCSLPGHPRLSPWHAARPQSKKTLFLACPGRIATTEIDFRRASPKPLETFMIEIAISCDMSQTFWTANEFRPETKTRTRPAISAKPESENRQSVWRRSAKKQDPPHGQKTYRLAQTKPTVSTQSGGGPSEILFSCHFRLAPKLGRRSPIAKFTYCRHSRKILARPSERQASKKMNQLGPANLRSAELGFPQTSS